MKKIINHRFIKIEKSQENINKMKKMRFKNRKTFREIGNHFKISHERVRQIIGSSKRLKKPLFKFVCQQCGKEKELETTLGNLAKKYCNKKCGNRSRWLNPEKPITEYTEEERKEYVRKTNLKSKKRRHLWYLANKEKCKKRNQTTEARAYFKEYVNRTEVKEKMKEYSKRPEVKEKMKEYQQRPKVKKRKKKYYQRPEVKEKINKRKRERYENDPKYRKKCEEYTKTPEAKERASKKERERYQNDPIYRSKRLEQQKRSYNLRKIRKNENK